MRRIALYARVSTTEQTPEPQLHALREYATARGLEVIHEYVDHGISGSRARRPALDRMMADARRRRLDAVAVVKLDRLGRSLVHLLNLTGELEALGVDLVSLDDGLDTSTPAGRLFFAIRGAFAEYERSLIVERTRAGLAAARRRGAKIGRPRRLSDLDRTRVGRLHAAGRSLGEIAALLGCSKSTVSREVRRRAGRRAA
jgi:DNA invertase Pin-like site-specific DNA recombinase